MDLFDVRNATPADRNPRLTFVGIDNDWLFPRQYVEDTAKRYRELGYASTYHTFPTHHGHDAFLAEAEALGDLLAPDVHFETTRPA
jgi:homoserine acetyltransferase